jgi:hypothetical protein
MVLKKSAQNSGKGDNTPVRTERRICIGVEASRWFFVSERLLFAFSCRNVTLSGASTRAKQCLIVASIVVFVFLPKFRVCGLQCQCVLQLV